MPKVELSEEKSILYWDETHFIYQEDNHQHASFLLLDDILGQIDTFKWAACYAFRLSSLLILKHR